MLGSLSKGHLQHVTALPMPSSGMEPMDLRVTRSSWLQTALHEAKGVVTVRRPLQEEWA